MLTQKETHIELDRLRRLALLRKTGTPITLEEIEGGFKALILRIPKNLSFLQYQYMGLFAQYAHCDCLEERMMDFFPFLAPVLERGEHGTLPEVDLDLLEWTLPDRRQLIRAVT